MPCLLRNAVWPWPIEDMVGGQQHGRLYFPVIRYQPSLILIGGPNPTDAPSCVRCPSPTAPLPA